MSTKAHGRYLGHGRLVRADRQERAPLGRRRHRRRARTAAGQPDHHRGQLLHRRPHRSGRRRDRRAKARSSAWASSSARAPPSYTAPPARSPTATSRPARSWSPATCRPPRRQATALYCAVIVKKVDAQTRSKTSVNDLLRCTEPASRTGSRRVAKQRWQRVLRLMAEKNASDVYMSANTPILIKIHGQILQLSRPVADHAPDTAAAAGDAGAATAGRAGRHR